MTSLDIAMNTEQRLPDDLEVKEGMPTLMSPWEGHDEDARFIVDGAGCHLR